MASTLRLSSRALRFAAPAPLRAFNGRAYSTGKTTVRALDVFPLPESAC